MSDILAHTRHGERGMTLIEVLTVVFIIALTSSLVVLTLPERTSEAERFAERFAQDVSRAHDRAILSGRVVGIGFTRDRYQLEEWRSGEWQTVSGNSQSLPDRIDLVFLNASEADDEEETAPSILFDPTGVNTPIEILLRSRGERLSLVVKADGEVQIDAG